MPKDVRICCGDVLATWEDTLLVMQTQAYFSKMARYPSFLSNRSLPKQKASLGTDAPVPEISYNISP